jgi:hypothetical protein
MVERYGGRCREARTMSTPLHGLLDSHVDAFVAELRARLVVGAKEYGGSSFERPVAEIIGEIEQELLDVCGWSVIAWVRLLALRAAVDRVCSEGGEANG